MTRKTQKKKEMHVSFLGFFCAFRATSVTSVLLSLENQQPWT
jgi:hypothetical protein